MVDENNGSVYKVRNSEVPMVSKIIPFHFFLRRGEGGGGAEEDGGWASQEIFAETIIPSLPHTKNK